MHTARLIWIGILTAVLCLETSGQSGSDDAKYKMIATKQTSTMQAELEDAAKRGYRLVAGTETSGSEVLLFLERDTTSSTRFSYKLLATKLTSTMEKEVNQLAKAGYRLLPNILVTKKTSVLNREEEIVLVMELIPDSVSRYEYKLLATALTKTLDKEVAGAAADGFKLKGVFSRTNHINVFRKGEHMVIMEKESPSASKDAK